MPIPLPRDDEDYRLAVLRDLHVLDTPPEQDFDRIALAAKRLLRADSALISLIDDDRVWFKSRYGFEAKEVDRGLSFCAHAIAPASMFIVLDATKLNMFVDHPLVAGPPHIRFYAGAPLIVDDAAIGVLCVIDSKPHVRLTDSQKAAFARLAEEAADLFIDRKQTGAQAAARNARAMRLAG